MEEIQDPKRIKKQQDRIRARYSVLAEADKKQFTMLYAKMQAEEVCNYLNMLALTPFTGLYSSLKQFYESSDNMYRFYTCLNEYGVLEPDTDRIQNLELTDPKPE